ncbi:TolC family protein [Maribacter thermophilus]|uniref:TolC family protein n=1 Tax=Maribacter thermophilus TaxID=1197874 RepID=UPI0006410295|nr:TolC family protein [Maribacter thermophilus]
MKNVLFILFMVCCFVTQAQQPNEVVLGFNEYLGYVKKYHPVVKQAQLNIGMGQARLMRARGGFDPKIEIDYDRKEFKGTEYYDRLNATFKIPTWYGIELKGNFEQNQGVYLNADETLPDDGLYSAGVSMSVGQGLWINQRMATLRQAKIFRERSLVERDLQVNEVLYEASLAYFNWLHAYQDTQVYADFLANAEMRFEGVKKSAQVGEVAAIDTVEAKITVQDRALNLEQAKVRFLKSALELSNFLWMGDHMPVELQANVIPETNLAGEIDKTLEIRGIPLDSFSIERHPKLKSLGYKVEELTVEKRLKANKLLPKIELQYNFLTQKPDYISSFTTEAYKGGVAFSVPLFLRKERGDLKLAKIKLQNALYEMDDAEIRIKNKIVGLYQELESFKKQNNLIDDVVFNYNTMVAAEERKFGFGESSLFLVNSRESKLIDAELKRNAVRNKFFSTKAKLFNSIGVNPVNL